MATHRKKALRSGQIFRLYLLGISVIVIVVASNVLPFPPVHGLIENRVLAPRPEWPANIEEWAQFPSKFDAYVHDQFGPRSHLISSFNYLRYLAGYSGTKSVIVGKEGWLFFDDGRHFGVARGTKRLTPQQVQDWVAGFEQRLDYANQYKFKFYMISPPNKEQIYPEYLPEYIRPTGVTTEIDDILDSLAAKKIDQFVDVRGILWQQKRSNLLYSKYDTHWTGVGAYFAYRALMQRISKDFPSLVPMDISAFPEEQLTFAQTPRDLSSMLGITDKVPLPRSHRTSPLADKRSIEFLGAGKNKLKSPQILTTGAHTGLTLLMIRDSFSEAILPYLEPHFSRIILCHVKACRLNSFSQSGLVQKYQPDIVILEVIQSGARYSMDKLP